MAFRIRWAILVVIVVSVGLWLASCYEEIEPTATSTIEPTDTQTLVPTLRPTSTQTPKETVICDPIPENVMKIMEYVYDNQGNWWIYQVMLSPDFHKFAYHTDNKLYVYNAITDSTAIVDPIGEGLGKDNFWFVGWSPDSKKFILTTDFDGQFKNYDPNNIVLIYQETVDQNGYEVATYTPSDLYDRMAPWEDNPEDSLPVGLFPYSENLIWDTDSQSIYVIYNDYTDVINISADGTEISKYRYIDDIQNLPHQYYIDLIAGNPGKETVYYFSRTSDFPTDSNWYDAERFFWELNLVTHKTTKIELPLNGNSLPGNSIGQVINYRNLSGLLYTFIDDTAKYLNFYDLINARVIFTLSVPHLPYHPYEIDTSSNQQYILIHHGEQFLLYNVAKNTFDTYPKSEGDEVIGWSDEANGFVILTKNEDCPVYIIYGK